MLCDQIAMNSGTVVSMNAVGAAREDDARLYF